MNKFPIVLDLETYLEKVVKDLSDKFGVSTSEIREVFMGVGGESTPRVSSVKEVPVAAAPNNLKKLTKPELVELCKEKKLKTTGNKADLIARLEGGGEVVEKKPAAKGSPESKVVTNLIYSDEKKDLTIPKIINNFSQWTTEDKKKLPVLEMISRGDFPIDQTLLPMFKRKLIAYVGQKQMIENYKKSKEEFKI